jgi:hypothetical protein
MTVKPDWLQLESPGVKAEARTLTPTQAQTLRDLQRKVFGTYLQLSQLLKDLDLLVR